MLVAGASATLVGLGDALLHRFNVGMGDSIRSDPIRIVEAVITGVAFLGAGTIFRRREGKNVEGPTTAASLLLSAAIGMSVALRQFILAGGITALTLLVLRGLTFESGIRIDGQLNEEACGLGAKSEKMNGRERGDFEVPAPARDFLAKPAVSSRRSRQRSRARRPRDSNAGRGSDHRDASCNPA